MSNIALSLYSALMRLAQPLLRRRMARRSILEPGYGQAIDERFGRYVQPAETHSQLVWLHAVSLGETRAASVLLGRLRVDHPGLRLLLTHGTATGRAEGLALLRPGDVQVWQPWDTLPVVERFFAHFKPRVGLLMETEVWPCTVAVSAKHNMPLLLCNGRLSEKSFHQALRMSPLALPAYAALTAVYAQTAADADRYRKLGASKVHVFGNLKFDAGLDAGQQATGKAWRQAITRPVVMFASSREGEESLFIDQISAVAQEIQARIATDNIAIQWLVVPRHPQRFDAVAALVVQSGLTLSRRSSWRTNPLESPEAMQADVWLGDSLGEMALYYSLSRAALLGGSFAPLGGQNLIEAASAGCPVIMGPHTFNFAEAAQLAVEGGAALRCADMERAVDAAVDLVRDPSAQSQMSEAATAFASSHRGATDRTAEALASYLV